MAVQYEQRWMQLIDRARQETIDQRKKSEKTQTLLDEKLSSYREQLLNTQQLLHEKSAELAVTLQQTRHLQKKVEALEKKSFKKKNILNKSKNKKI